MEKNKALPNFDSDPTSWYQEVISRAKLAEHSPVKGCMIIRPYGHAIWELIQRELDRRIKERGVENAYFPIFIPQSFLAREKDHLEGFSPELAVVTHAGGEKLEEPLVIRPTSETIIHESMARWINSYRDLPLKINQWANVVRWEKRPRLFLRNTEFLWQEGHTAHSSEAEARAEVLEILDVYYNFAMEFLSIPTIKGKKSEQEKFAGAVNSYSIEGLMPDGKGLQMGTAHYLGDNFSRMANVRYLNNQGEHKFVEMTSWGVSTRLMGALIMSHGDDRGLVLPPSVAPYQVVVIPILGKEGAIVSDKAFTIAQHLKSVGIRVKLDDRQELSPGVKFYEWESKGVPIRIEIGSRDIEKGILTIARRDNQTKVSIPDSQLASIPDLLQEIQSQMRTKAVEKLGSQTAEFTDREDFVEYLKGQIGFAISGWCDSIDCENAIKEETTATIRNIPITDQSFEGTCIWCGKTAVSKALFSKAY